MLRSLVALRGLPRIGARMMGTVARPVLSINRGAFVWPITRLSGPQLITKPTSIVNEIPTGMFESEIADEVDNTLYMDSVLRKRRLKMKKHKLRKRRREQRSLKKRLGKI